MRRALLLTLTVLTFSSTASDAAHRLVFGSFGTPDNAERFAEVVRVANPSLEIAVAAIAVDGRRTHRVVSQPLTAPDLALARRQASIRINSSIRLSFTGGDVD